MFYVEIWAVGWILWTVVGSLLDDSDVRLVMLAGLFWPLIVPVIAVVLPFSLLTDYARKRKHE